MGSGRRDVSIYSLGAEGALWALILSAPLMLGGAPAWALWPIVSLPAIAFALSCVGAYRQKQSIETAPVVLVFFAAAALCALQLVPLPPALLKLLSPEAAELREFALVPLGLDGARPVSMDPPATWRELAKHLAYALTALSILHVARSRRARRRLTVALATSGGVVTLIGLGHLLVQANTLFGVHAFEGAVPFVTPFGNPNHLAAFLTLTAAAALGLAATAADRPRLVLWSLLFVLAGVGALLSLSRGGIVSFFVVPIAFTALLLAKRRVGESANSPAAADGLAPEKLRARREANRLTLVAGAIVATIAVAGTGAYIAWEQLSTELQSADSVEKIRHSKIELWPSFVDAASHFPVLGMGRGAFEAAFPRYQTQYADLTFTHPENAILQLGAELGVVGGALIGALAIWAVLRILRRKESGAGELALIAGVIAVVLHDQLDFALELPATALTAVALLSLATRGADDRTFSLTVPRAAIAGGVALALLAGAAWFGRSTLRSEDTRLAELAKTAPAEVVRAVTLAAIDRHPAHYALYDVLCRLESDPKKGRPQEALAYANRALYLRPQDTDAHWLAARALLRMGRRSQAFLEYRLAYEVRLASQDVLLDGLRFAKGADELRRLVPNDPDNLTNLVTTLRQRNRAAEADAVLGAAIDDLADHPRVAELWALRAAYKLDAHDADAALKAIDEAAKRLPDDPQIAIRRATILAALGRRDEGVSALEALTHQHPDDVPIAFALAGQLLAAGKNHQARDALARVSPFVGASTDRVVLLSIEGSSYEAEGRAGRALQSFESASHLDPGNPSIQLSIARLSESLGRYEDAEQAVRAAMAVTGDGDGSLKSWLARLDEKEQARKLDRERRILEPAPEDRGLE